MSDTEASLQDNMMLASAPCGLLKTDHFGTVLVANEKLGEWLGLSPSQLGGMPVKELFSKASRIVFETSIVPLLSLKGQVDGASLDLVNREGEKMPVLLSAAVIGTGESSVRTFVFLLADARRAFERDLAKARVEAETLLSSSQREGELREQFIGILGHDLRNPLASIASAMNILSRETLSENSAHIVTLTKGSVQRMSLLIDNVLDFARNRLGGGIALRYSDVLTLESEIRQVIAELRSVHPDREVVLDLGFIDEVKCDVARLGCLTSALMGPYSSI